MKRFTVLSFLLFLASTLVLAQPDSSSVSYPAINENKLANTTWRYTYTAHAQSNTVIHKAEKGYDYYLNLKYDGTLEHYLNGRYYKSEWRLNAAKNEIYYNFRQVSWWRIATFTDKQLVLEFSMNNKSSYRYYFVAIPKKEAPFILAPNELPQVDVETYVGDTKTSRVAQLAEARKNKLADKKAKKNAKKAAREAKKNKKGGDKPKKQPKEKTPPPPPPVYIQIELVGGGYYGGIDPVYSSFIKIETDGRLVKEIKTEKRGLVKTKKTIPRKDLETFLAWVDTHNFFTYEMYYNCKTSVCNKRLNLDPRPIPMRLVITYGDRRKVVTVSIFGKDENNLQYVDYPKDLDEIVDAIQRMAG